MPLTYKDLSTPISTEEAAATLFRILAALDFPVSAWGEKNAGRLLVLGFVRFTDSIRKAIAAIASSAFLPTAEGDWLDLLSENVYGVKRLRAAPARRRFHIADVASVGPLTLEAGRFVIRDELGNRYVLSETADIQESSFLDLVFQAELTGTLTNPDYRYPLAQVTPIPGLLVTFVDDPANTLSGGLSEELDPSLRARDLDALEALSPYGLAGAYRKWVIDSHPPFQPTRVQVGYPLANQPGVFLIYVAGARPETPISAVQTEFLNQATLDAIAAYIAPRKPAAAKPQIVTAYARRFTVNATVFRNPNIPVSGTQVIDALQAYFETFPIGGFDIQGDGTGWLVSSMLIPPIMAVPGVLAVSISSPTSLELSPGEIPYARPITDGSVVTILP